MVERYTFTNTLAGLRLALRVTLSLRKAGFTTVLFPRPFTVGKLTFEQLHLEATPAPRANRAARGCNLVAIGG
jgi:hypothetical protein